jgi:hypothetical protein
MNLIRIVDNLNDEEYIYSDEIDISLETAALSLVDKLKHKVLTNVEYNICENKCEIFVNEDIVERGWVWNSKNKTRKILYKLSYIPVFSVREKPETINKSVQTEGLVKKSRDFRQQTEELYIKNNNTDIYNVDNFFNPDDYKIDVGMGYSNNPFDPVYYNSGTYTENVYYNQGTLPSNNIKGTLPSSNPYLSIWSDPNHKYAINYTAPQQDYIQESYDYDVSITNPFMYPNNDLNTEIKNRLALPNFGLRHFKQD